MDRGPEWGRTIHAWFWGGGALLGALVALVCADVALATRVTGDLGQAMRSDGRRLYSPVRSDNLAGSGKLQAALAHVPDDALHRPWLGLILDHPGIYLRTRAAIFRWLVLTPNLDLSVPHIVGVDGPPKIMRSLGLEPRYSPRDELSTITRPDFLGRHSSPSRPSWR